METEATIKEEPLVALTVKIASSSSAFEYGQYRQELSRMLKELASEVESGNNGSGKFRDINGNPCGYWSLGVHIGGEKP